MNTTQNARACPSCGSADARSLRVIYESGTRESDWSGRAATSRGTVISSSGSSTSQTIAAQRSAPPRRPGHALLIVSVLVISFYAWAISSVVNAQPENAKSNLQAVGARISESVARDGAIGTLYAILSGPDSTGKYPTSTETMQRGTVIGAVLGIPILAVAGLVHGITSIPKKNKRHAEALAKWNRTMRCMKCGTHYVA